MSNKFPYYIHKLSEESEFLRDGNGYSVLDRGGDVGFAGYMKEAAIACFNAFNKADHENQKLFISKLIKEMGAFAHIEWYWPEEEVEWRMGKILREEQKIGGEFTDG